MDRLRLIAVFVAGAALGGLATHHLGADDRDDGEIAASLAELRVQLASLERSVQRRERPVVAAAMAPAVPPVDPSLVAAAEGFVRTAIAGRVWNDGHRDQWLALQAQLDGATRERLLLDLMAAANRQELRLETPPGPAF